MPSINELKNIKKTSNLFKKKDYRPWTESTQLLKKEELIEDIKIKKTEYDSKIPLDLEKIWRHLYGAKKIILEQIINNIEEKNKDYCITYPLNTSQLEKITSLPANTIRSNFQRLKKEGLILFYERKPGVGGFARYQISYSLYNFFSEKFLIKK